ncbi:hypothetical protein L7F22_022113 [Adiantum nelumboides]|nr:hypothetical protein [Adiantum nelumboides]
MKVAQKMGTACPNEKPGEKISYRLIERGVKMATSASATAGHDQEELAASGQSAVAGGGQLCSLSCAICLSGHIRSPVLTCCGHAFCWPCVYRWYSINQSCPTCKGGLGSPADFTPIFSAPCNAAAPVAEVVDAAAVNDPIPPRPPPRRHRSFDDVEEDLFSDQYSLSSLSTNLGEQMDLQNSTASPAGVNGLAASAPAGRGRSSKRETKESESGSESDSSSFVASDSESSSDEEENKKHKKSSRAILIWFADPILSNSMKT